MAPSTKRTRCRVCSTNESKYNCPICLLQYCSVSCFKKHKEETCLTQQSSLSNESPQTTAEIPTLKDPQQDAEEAIEDPKPLRPLTSLKWPYISSDSEYSDPLKRDDPKTLQIHHYEAIATSPTVRKVLAAHPNLKALLTSINSQHGRERQQALERSLGVSTSDATYLSTTKGPSDEVLAFRELAEAIEAAVRGGSEGVLGLDWDSGE